MIEIPTVLILGAGASAPFGFPCGQALVDQVCDGILHKRPPIYSSLTKTLISPPIAKEFAERLSRSGEDSIDAFLEYQTEVFVKIGKTAIAAALLPCERGKGLFDDFMNRRLRKTQGNLTGDQDTVNNWYQYLWEQLKAPFDDFEKNKLSIITFNYDRSLEQYLFTVLKNKYSGKSDEEYAKKLNAISIIHVHGKLGDLPWQHAVQDPRFTVPYDSQSPNPHGFDREVEYETFKEIWFSLASESIKVIHEGTDETNELKQARQLITGSNQLYFLGFGYHPTNLTRLGVDVLRKPPKVMGTVYGLSYERIKEIKRLGIPYLNHIYGDNLIDKKVYDFLHENVDFKTL